MPVSRTVRPLLAAVPIVGIAAAIALLLRPDVVRAEPVEPPPPAGVQVDGVGTATGTPDVLRVTVGVETTADAVGEALEGTDAAARRVLDALRAEDVAEADVQTVGMSIYPMYADDGQRITGYTARHDLEVTLRDLGRAGEVIGVLTEVGGNAVRLQGVAYALEDDAAQQEEARAEAFAAARVKAEQLAALTGRELGDVIEVREQTTPSVPMPFAAADSGGAEAMSVALAPGSATVTVTVQVRWSLR
jgi:uncharacterized protein YggE